MGAGSPFPPERCEACKRLIWSDREGRVCTEAHGYECRTVAQLAAAQARIAELYRERKVYEELNVQRQEVIDELALANARIATLEGERDAANETAKFHDAGRARVARDALALRRAITDARAQLGPGDAYEILGRALAASPSPQARPCDREGCAHEAINGGGGYCYRHAKEAGRSARLRDDPNVYCRAQQYWNRMRFETGRSFEPEEEGVFVATCDAIDAHLAASPVEPLGLDDVPPEHHLRTLLSVAADWNRHSKYCDCNSCDKIKNAKAYIERHCSTPRTPDSGTGMKPGQRCTRLHHGHSPGPHFWSAARDENWTLERPGFDVPEARCPYIEPDSGARGRFTKYGRMGEEAVCLTPEKDTGEQDSGTGDGTPRRDET
jgi:hypothetical protein